MTHNLLARSLSIALLLAGCNGGTSMHDASPDGSMQDGGDVVNIDAQPEAAPDTGVGPDGAPLGCNPTGGIQCDGNWVGRCSPDCPADQCCSPQNGVFMCVPHDPSGRCPAADLFIDQHRLAMSPVVDWAYFDANACEIMEGCVNAPGIRRLLRFDSRTPNQGTADMYLGSPAGNPNFVYSSCHRHYHFTSYASYSLTGADGSVAARGHKQAFCLEDYERNGSSAPVHYDCSNQGIQMGWADTYWGALPCQWIDVTDVPPGSYTLNIQINTEHILNESDYTNNSATLPVTITSMPMPNPDPRTACSTTEMGLDRVCGWTFQGVHTCTPGAAVRVACSAACGLGSCVGDTMMRVYDGDRTAMGSIMFTSGMIASNDDSGCSGGDLCSLTHFACPADGTYSVLVGPYDTSAPATCNVATMP